MFNRFMQILNLTHTLIRRRNASAKLHSCQQDIEELRLRDQQGYFLDKLVVWVKLKIWKRGGTSRTRTDDHKFKRFVLYQLSYGPITLFQRTSYHRLTDNILCFFMLPSMTFFIYLPILGAFPIPSKDIHNNHSTESDWT